MPARRKPFCWKQTGRARRGPRASRRKERARRALFELDDLSDGVKKAATTRSFPPCKGSGEGSRDSLSHKKIDSYNRRRTSGTSWFAEKDRLSQQSAKSTRSRLLRRYAQRPKERGGAPRSASKKKETSPSAGHGAANERL